MKKSWYWIIALWIIPLLGWSLYGLFDLDEGFYAAVVVEMNRRGDWIIPYYNGHAWFEKPILLYWIAKPLVSLFGIQIGARLPSILAGLGTYALIAWFVNRRVSMRAAMVASYALSTSLLLVAVNRMMIVDPLLVFTLTGTFIFFYESLVDRKEWRILSAIFLGLSVLAKGPVGGALFIGTIAYFYWMEKDFRDRFMGFWAVGIAAFLVVVCSWYVPALIERGHEFIQKFFIEQNLDRFEGGDQAHKVGLPWGLFYYIIVILIGMAPWSIYAYKGLPTQKGTLQTHKALRKYLTCWAGSIFVLFTLAGSKLPTYILPAFPPLCVLAALFITRDETPESGQQPLPQNRLIRMTIGSLALFLFVQIGFTYYSRSSGLAEADAIAAYVKKNEKPGDRFAEFRLSWQDGAPASNLHVNATTLPSLVAYLNQDVIMADKSSDLISILSNPKSGVKRIWVLARTHKIASSDPEKFPPGQLVTIPGVQPRAYILYLAKGLADQSSH